MREGKILFDPIDYADSYGDIKTAFGNDVNAIVRHYLDHGIEENRTEGNAGIYADLAVKQETEERIAEEEAEREAEANSKSFTNVVDEFLGHMVTARNLVWERNVTPDDLTWISRKLIHYLCEKVENIQIKSVKKLNVFNFLRDKLILFYNDIITAKQLRDFSPENRS